LAGIAEKFMIMEKKMDTLEGWFKGEALNLMENVTKELEPIVARAMRDPKYKIELPGRKRYNTLFEEFMMSGTIAGYKTARDEIKVKMGQVKDVKLTSIYDPFVWTEKGMIPTDAVTWMDNWTDHFGNGYYGDATDSVVEVLKTGIKEGYSHEEIMGQLSEVLKGPQFNMARLETISRTNMTTSFNVGRVILFKEHRDFVPAMQFSSILDERTTFICFERHGHIMLIDDNDTILSEMPPLHYNCRSMLLPITIYEIREIDNYENLTNWKGLEKPQIGINQVPKGLQPNFL